MIRPVQRPKNAGSAAEDECGHETTCAELSRLQELEMSKGFAGRDFNIFSPRMSLGVEITAYTAAATVEPIKHAAPQINDSESQARFSMD